jgi:hypothetical protein
MKRSSAPITVQIGHREFIKVNATNYDWRDIYHFILTFMSKSPGTGVSRTSILTIPLAVIGWTTANFTTR